MEDFFSKLARAFSSLDIEPPANPVDLGTTPPWSPTSRSTPSTLRTPPLNFSTPVPKQPAPPKTLEELKAQNLQITAAPELSAISSFFKRLPQSVQDVGTQLKEGFFGRGQEVDIAGNLKEDTGLVGFQGILGKSDFAKVVSRLDALEEAGIDSARANEIALVFAKKSGILTPVQLDTDLKKLNLTPEEQGVLGKINFFERLNQGLASLDFVSLGTISIGKSAALRIAKTIDVGLIKSILKEEIADLSDKAADAFSKALKNVDNADDVQKVINRIDYQLSNAKKGEAASEASAEIPQLTKGGFQKGDEITISPKGGGVERTVKIIDIKPNGIIAEGGGTFRLPILFKSEAFSFTKKGIERGIELPATQKNLTGENVPIETIPEQRGLDLRPAKDAFERGNAIPEAEVLKAQEDALLAKQRGEQTLPSAPTVPTKLPATLKEFDMIPSDQQEEIFSQLPEKLQYEILGESPAQSPVDELVDQIASGHLKIRPGKEMKTEAIENLGKGDYMRIFRGNQYAKRFDEVAQEFRDQGHDISTSDLLDAIVTRLDERAKIKAEEKAIRETVRESKKAAREAAKTPEQKKKVEAEIEREVTRERLKSRKPERRFFNTLLRSPAISPEIKSAIGELPEDIRTYDVFTNKEAVRLAEERIAKNREAAIRYVLTAELDKEVHATGMALVSQLQKGTLEDKEIAVDIVNRIALGHTNRGQYSQAASMVSKLGPDGVLLFATRRITKAIEEVEPGKIKQLDTTTKDVVEKLKTATNEATDEVVKELERQLKEARVKITPEPATPVKTTKEPAGILDDFEDMDELEGGKKPKKDPAEKLADRIKVNEKEKKIDPVQDMVNTLFKVAQQVLPAKKIPVPRNQIELIGQAIKDKELYKEVWEKAQGLVEEKYANNETALDLLSEYFDTFLERPFAEKQLTTAVKQGIKAKELDLGKIVRQHYSTVKEARGSLSARLVREAGVSEAEATGLASQIEGKFDELVKAKQSSILDSIFKDRTQKQIDLTDRIIELANLGAFDSAKYRPLVAKKLNIGVLSPELAGKLVTQAEKIQTIPINRPYDKFVETQKLIDMIAHETPQSLGVKVLDWAAELANVLRTFQSSFVDLSGNLRQGVVSYARHPIASFKAAKSQFKPFLGDKYYGEVMNEIMVHPDFEFANESGVAFSDINLKLSGREERYQSSLAEKIPGFGQIFRGTNRSYTALMNKLRMDTFAALNKSMELAGFNPRKDEKLAKGMASIINDSTGRGNLPEFLERAAPLLNAFFYSPRLMASRLNMLVPVRYITAHPAVRKEYLKTMLAFGGVVTTILGLSQLIPGVTVEDDMRSADFGKIKTGNTRFEITGGFQSYLRIFAQVVTGKYVSSSTGKIVTLGEGYKPLSLGDILLRGVESKEAPIFSLLTEWGSGQNDAGEKFDMTDAIQKRFHPMLVDDLWDLYKDDPSLFPAGFLGALGVGVQTYAPPEAYIKLNEINNSEDPAAEFDKLAEENPKLAAKVKIAKLQENFTEFDWGLTYMGVENGDRAVFLMEHFKKIPSDEAKAELFDDLRAKKLISDKVAEQINYLVEHPDYRVEK